MANNSNRNKGAVTKQRNEKNVPGALPLVSRLGPEFDGSARWALRIAQPYIDKFAHDAQLYSIVGEYIHKDGRLLANAGSWSFLVWSKDNQKISEVTVNYDGTASNTTRNPVSPTLPVSESIPAQWVNTPRIFRAIAPHQTIVAKLAYSAVLSCNLNPPQSDQITWSILFNEREENIRTRLHPTVGYGTLHRVNVAGAYLAYLPAQPRTYQLISPFLKRDPCIHRIMSGTPYNMDDPDWLKRTMNIPYQNRNIVAYKIFASLHMIGYNTGPIDPLYKPHVKVLNKFQQNNGLPVNSFVTGEVLEKLDQLLFTREQKIAARAKEFPLYDHMQPLHRNDISQDWLALIYHLPMTVLPEDFHMSVYETVQCIYEQGLGFIQDVDGNEWPVWPVDITKNYRFAGAYFDPKQPATRLPSAALCVGTVLHEYAHYLDEDRRRGPDPLPDSPCDGSIPTATFHDISYDMSTRGRDGCVTRRSDDPKAYITKYGFVANNGCEEGKYQYTEEFAEAFSIYVAAGRHFMAAALQNVTIAQKYDWLRDNVFGGREYDTDLQRGVESGCNDVPGYEDSQPGYTSCSEDYVWDGELRIL
jgi:hypothetical protein